MKNKQQANIVTNDLMALKLDLVQMYGLTYIQACKVIEHIENEMVMNETDDETDFIFEMIELKNKTNK